MTVLLDTCAYLIATHQPAALPEPAKQAILAAKIRYWSPVGTWEIAVKSALGRLDFPTEAFTVLNAGLSALQVTHLPLTHLHCGGVHNLPALHRDPFDRLLIAQCLAERAVLVTSDKIIPTYPGITTVWA